MFSCKQSGNADGDQLPKTKLPEYQLVEQQAVQHVAGSHHHRHHQVLEIGVDCDKEC